MITVSPGQRGARKLLAQYGDRLVRARYHYDEQRHKRLKTVALIMAEDEWGPPVLPPARDRLVLLRVAASELALRTQGKRAGGKGDRTEVSGTCALRKS
jgi:hypothetical protein